MYMYYNKEIANYNYTNAIMIIALVCLVYWLC